MIMPNLIESRVLMNDGVGTHLNSTNVPGHTRTHTTSARPASRPSRRGSRFHVPIQAQPLPPSPFKPQAISPLYHPFTSPAVFPASHGLPSSPRLTLLANAKPKPRSTVRGPSLVSMEAASRRPLPTISRWSHSECETHVTRASDCQAVRAADCRCASEASAGPGCRRQ